MPLSPSEYQDRLDVVTKEIRDIEQEHGDAVKEHRKLKAEYELVEANVFRSEDYSVMNIGERERVAKVVAEENCDRLWSRYNAAKGNLERLNRLFESKDVVRSNIQSNLKVSK